MLNAWAEQIPLLGKGGVDAPSRNIPVPLKGADGEAVKKLESSAIPLLASLRITARRGGRAIQKISRSIRLSRGRGGFPMNPKGKPPRLVRSSVASPNSL